MREQLVFTDRRWGRDPHELPLPVPKGLFGAMGVWERDQLGQRFYKYEVAKCQRMAEPLDLRLDLSEVSKDILVSF